MARVKVGAVKGKGAPNERNGHRQSRPQNADKRPGGGQIDDTKEGREDFGAGKIRLDETHVWLEVEKRRSAEVLLGRGAKREWKTFSVFERREREREKGGRRKEGRRRPTKGEKGKD